MRERDTPGARRLRGWLSGDAARIERTFQRCNGVADRSIHRAVAEALPEIRASLANVPLARDLGARIDAYLDSVHAGRPVVYRPGNEAVVQAVCVCERAGGDPSRKAGFRKVGEQVFAGHSEMDYVCEGCGARWEVTEDAGYHVPQYSWKRRS